MSSTCHGYHGFGHPMHWISHYNSCDMHVGTHWAHAARHVKVSQPGSHGLAHHEPGWKWVNLTRHTFWWARNFVTRLNPPRVDGLSGLVHQPTQKKYLFIYLFKYLNKFLSNPWDNNHSKIKNQCFDHAHHQYMKNYLQESIH